MILVPKMQIFRVPNFSNKQKEKFIIPQMQYTAGAAIPPSFFLRGGGIVPLENQKNCNNNIVKLWKAKERSVQTNENAKVFSPCRKSVLSWYHVAQFTRLRVIEKDWFNKNEYSACSYEEQNIKKIDITKIIESKAVTELQTFPSLIVL